VLTRSVRDSAAMLDAVCGPLAGDPYFIPKPGSSFLAEVDQEPASLKIGFSTKSPLGTDVHPECVKAVEHAARLLESLGHVVEEADPGVDGTALAKSYFMMYFGEVAADIQDLVRVLGRKPRPADVEGPTWALSLLGNAYSAGEFVLSLREWNKASRAMAAYFGSHDLLLTPTTAFPPAKIGELRVKGVEEFLMRISNRLGIGRIMRLSGIADKVAVESLARTPFTQLANVTGLPAASVPLYWTPDNLPCGVQLVAPYAEEALIIRLAAQLEKAQPWFDRVP
jgi:amidase